MERVHAILFILHNIKCDVKPQRSQDVEKTRQSLSVFGTANLCGALPPFGCASCIKKHPEPYTVRGALRGTMCHVFSIRFTPHEPSRSFRGRSQRETANSPKPAMKKNAPGGVLFSIFPLVDHCRKVHAIGGNAKGLSVGDGGQTVGCAIPDAGITRPPLGGLFGDGLIS